MIAVIFYLQYANYSILIYNYFSFYKWPSKFYKGVQIPYWNIDPHKIVDTLNQSRNIFYDGKVHELKSVVLLQSPCYSDHFAIQVNLAQSQVMVLHSV